MSSFFDKNVMIMFNSLSSSIDDYIFISDFVSNKTIWSESTVRDFDMPAECLSTDVQMLWGSRIHPNDVEEYNHSLNAVFEHKTDNHKCDYRILNNKGEYIWVQCCGHMTYTDDNKPYVFIGIITALGRKRRIDYKTGLLSSYEFNRRMESEIKSGSLAGGIINISIADISGLNSIYSYKYGDRAIEILADVLTHIAPPDQMIYRGGNHFAIYNRNATREYFIEIYDRIRNNFIKALSEDDKLRETGIKIHSGAIMVDDITAASFDELYQQMLHCTNVARENDITESPVFFSSEMYSQIRTNNSLITELSRCVKHDINSFILYYQPIIEHGTNNLRSAEALLRWSNPLSKKFSILDIVTTLESTQLIIPLGRHIISTALKQLAVWKKTFPNMHININIAIPQISDPGLLEFIENEIKTNGLKPSDVVFEITETGEIKNYSKIQDFAVKLHEMGCEIALDDFGTGNASLNSLKLLPVDWVKVDQNFILKIAQNKVDESILKHLTELCHSLDIKLCVEGVGSLESLEVVQKYFPDSLQGYHFSTPIPSDEFSEFMKNYITK